VRACLGFVAVLCLAACGADAPAPESRREAPVAAGSEVRPAPAPDRTGAPVLVCFGDSLTAGYGVGLDESYPAFLQRELDERGLEFRVVNEGVSGDTTSAALQRVDMALAHRPAWVVMALGGNDGLRGLPTDAMEANLRQMVERFRSSGARVVVAGITLPPNFGAEYIGEFHRAFGRAAKQTGVPLLPYLLDGVGGDEALNLGDGIHPNARGNRIVARTVADFLEPLLRGPAGR
jgi:acyl-CoA thioesterase I